MNAPIPPDAVSVASLPVAQIAPSLSNPRKRFDDAYIAELADSIKNHGLIQPITVRPIPLDSFFAFNKARKAGDESQQPTYEIVVGECRWRAAKLAGLTEIPAFWRELDDKQVLEIQVVENLQRRDVHEIEEAEGYERLMKLHGYTADTLAEKIGKSRSYIYQRLKLIALAPKARDLFYEGKLSASTALLIARIPGVTLQMKAAADITKPDYKGEVPSYRAAFDFIQNNYMLDLDEATFKMDDADLVKAAGSCDACPKRSGNDLLLFADINDPNVCTDPPCFNDKRDANYLRLKAAAEKSGKEMITGDAAHDMTYNGSYSLRAHNLTRIDDKCFDDPERRTYREILGEKAPAVTLVEDARQKVFIEAIDNRQLEAALRKAGIGKPEPKQSKEERERKKQREEKEALAKAEQPYRARLHTAVLEKLRNGAEALDSTQLIGLMAAAWLRFDFSFNKELDAVRLGRFGIDVANDTDADTERDELDRVAEIVSAWPLNTSVAFLFDVMTSEETNTNIYRFDPERDLTFTLLALANMLHIDADYLRNPEEVQPNTAKPAKTKPAKTASPPANAAQAQAKGATQAALAPAALAPGLKAIEKELGAKKTKAKADPAPAKPANEAAAPPKTTERPAWPFPTGARG